MFNRGDSSTRQQQTGQPQRQHSYQGQQQYQGPQQGSQQQQKQKKNAYAAMGTFKSDDHSPLGNVEYPEYPSYPDEHNGHHQSDYYQDSHEDASFIEDASDPAAYVGGGMWGQDRKDGMEDFKDSHCKDSKDPKDPHLKDSHFKDQSSSERNMKNYRTKEIMEQQLALSSQENLRKQIQEREERSGHVASPLHESTHSSLQASSTHGEGTIVAEKNFDSLGINDNSETGLAYQNHTDNGQDNGENGTRVEESYKGSDDAAAAAAVPVNFVSGHTRPHITDREYLASFFPNALSSYSFDDNGDLTGLNDAADTDKKELKRLLNSHKEFFSTSFVSDQDKAKELALHLNKVSAPSETGTSSLRTQLKPKLSKLKSFLRNL
jgi:hypothetical protein